MRVLTITNLYPPDVIGGYEIGCHQMARALRERGHEVLVLTSSGISPSASGEVDGVTVRRALNLAPMFVQLHGAPTAYTADVDLPGRLLEGRNVERLADAIRDFRPDACYLWNLVGVGGLALVALLEYIGQPWTWHLMDQVPLDVCRVGGAVSPVLATQLSHVEHGSYIACSRRLASEVEAGGVALRSGVEIVPNWIDDTAPWAAPRVRSFWTQGTRAPMRLLHAGRLGREKGTDIAVDVTEDLARQGHSLRLDLYGTAVDAAGRPPQSEAVRVCGSVPHAVLVEAMLGYDVMLFPTWPREPFAFSALEAAAQGCVPILSAGSGNAEWMRDGLHCVHAPRTRSGFRRAVVDVIEAGNLEARARAAATAVREDFALSRVARSVEHVLSDAARVGSGRLDDLPRACAIARGAEALLTDAWPPRLTQWRRRAYLAGRTVHPLVRRLPYNSELSRRALRLIAGR